MGDFNLNSRVQLCQSEVTSVPFYRNWSLMAQWLIGLADLLETLDLILSTHMVVHNHV